MPDEHPAVSIVAALRNEAATVEDLVNRIRTTMERADASFEIVLVDDGSHDRTVEIIRRLEAADERLRVHELTRSFGQNAAVACGLFAARGAVVVTLDADLQNPPEEIPKLLGALTGASIATGRRATRYEGRLRWLASRGLHWLARWVTGVGIDDFGGNFKAYHRQVIEEARKFWAPPKHFFTTALQLGFPVTEVTVRHEPRTIGHSHYTLALALWTNLSFVIAHTTLPLVVLGLIGAVAMAVGAAGVTACWFMRDPHWFTVGTFLTLFAAGAPLCAAAALGLYLGQVHHCVVGGVPAFVVKEGPRRASC
jgi:undecaprenyl-phosphate 4-deoxy-4-formamido-L-arabinose transferase